MKDPSPAAPSDPEHWRQTLKHQIRHPYITGQGIERVEPAVEETRTESCPERPEAGGEPAATDSGAG